MSTLSMGGNTGEAVALVIDAGVFDINMGSLRQCSGIGAYQCACKTGDGVGDRTAVKLHDLLVRDGGRGKLAVIDALLATNERELSIRCKAKRRLGIALKIVGDIAHTGFLVVADNCAQGVWEKFAGFFDVFDKEMRSPKRQHKRTLVVQNASAEQIAVFACDVQRINRPSKTKRHNIGMSNGGDVLL